MKPWKKQFVLDIQALYIFLGFHYYLAHLVVQIK